MKIFEFILAIIYLLGLFTLIVGVIKAPLKKDEESLRSNS